MFVSGSSAVAWTPPKTNIPSRTERMQKEERRRCPKGIYCRIDYNGLLRNCEPWSRTTEQAPQILLFKLLIWALTSKGFIPSSDLDRLETEVVVELISGRIALNIVFWAMKQSLNHGQKWPPFFPGVISPFLWSRRLKILHFFIGVLLKINAHDRFTLPRPT